MEKVGRNDPCPCGSGKKFKKCCADKMNNRFMAHKIEGSSLTSRITQATSGITTFFKDKMVTNITATKGLGAKEQDFQPVGLEEF